MRKTLIVLAALLVCLAAVSADTYFSGSIDTHGSATLPYTSSGLSILDAGATLTGVLDYYSYDNYGSMHVDASLSYNLKQAQSASNRLNLVSGTESFGFRLKEAYYDYYDYNWGFRVGRQIVTWGAADSLTLTNVICPDDDTSLSSSDVSESKLGVDAVKLSFNTDSLVVDGYWIPFFRPSALPLDSSNPLRAYMIPSSVTTPGGTLTISDFTSDDLDTPALGFENGEYGLRVSGFTSDFDYSLYGFYGFEDTPIVTYTLESATSIKLGGQYKRMAMVGADASVPVGGVTFRFESAFYPQRSIARSATYQLMNAGSDASEKHNELSFLGGIDYMKGDWTITAQYYGDYLFGATDNLGRDNYSHTATVSVSTDLLDGNLSVSVAGVVGLDAFDSAITAGLSYSLSDEITVSLDAMAFNPGPEKDGTYGAMKDLSNVSLKGSYSF